VRVRYALIIMEGAIDESIVALDGMTPLEAAATPNTDVIARAGRVGLSAASPSGMRPSAASATLSLLGCDPGVVAPAAGPLAALARGVEISPGDRVWRLSLLDAPGGVVRSVSPGGVDAPEARALLGLIVESWRERAPDLAERFRATAVDPTGCVLVERDGAAGEAVEIAMPLDLIGERWGDWAPRGKASEVGRLMEIAAEALSGSDANRARRDAGASTVDAAWIWGAGETASAASTIGEQFDLRGALAGRSEHAVGGARLVGLERLPVPGDGLGSLGESVAGALDRYELVVAHTRAPAEASLAGDVEGKVRAIEAIDAEVVGPTLSRLDRLDRLGERAPDAPGDEGFRIMVAATAEVSCLDRRALDFPTLVAMGGTWLRGAVERRLVERDAARSDLRVEPGHEILEYFLRSGLRVKPRAGAGRARSMEEAPE